MTYQEVIGSANKTFKKKSHPNELFIKFTVDSSTRILKIIEKVGEVGRLWEPTDEDLLAEDYYFKGQ